MAGLNTEIVHNTVSFHVQTQDKGLGANYVESIIYKSGRVLSSRRSYYTAYLDREDLPETIALIIENQHHAVLEEISQGKFDHL